MGSPQCMVAVIMDLIQSTFQSGSSHESMLSTYSHFSRLFIQCSVEFCCFANSLSQFGGLYLRNLCWKNCLLSICPFSLSQYARYTAFIAQLRRCVLTIVHWVWAIEFDRHTFVKAFFPSTVQILYLTEAPLIGLPGYLAALFHRSPNLVTR